MNSVRNTLFATLAMMAGGLAVLMATAPALAESPKAPPCCIVLY